MTSLTVNDTSIAHDRLYPAIVLEMNDVDVGNDVDNDADNENENENENMDEYEEENENDAGRISRDSKAMRIGVTRVSKRRATKRKKWKQVHVQEVHRPSR